MYKVDSQLDILGPQIFQFDFLSQKFLSTGAKVATSGVFGRGMDLPIARIFFLF